MANQKKLALALVFVVSRANADNCMIASKGTSKLKASLTGKTCNTHMPNLESCYSACCDDVTDICFAVRWNQNGKCPETHYTDESKKPNKATLNNYGTNCCTAKKVCDVNCASKGEKNKKDYAIIKCQEKECSTWECCDKDATKCTGAEMAGGECNSDSFPDEEKKTNEASKDTYQSKCCTAKKTCDVTCKEGYEKNKNYDIIKCDAAQCRHSECCGEMQNNVCMWHRPASGKGCSKTESKIYSGTAVKTDSSDFKTKCCKARLTCEEFKAATLETASGAVGQQVFATAILIFMGGYLLCGK